MEPLSQEEIEHIEEVYSVSWRVNPKFWDRLIYTARLGAEFVKQTQTAQEDK